MSKAQISLIVSLLTHTYSHTHTVHMALVGYLIVFSVVTKPGQTLEFLLWGTIVPLNFLVGYHCSIVASTPQPMAYASILRDMYSCTYTAAFNENGVNFYAFSHRKTQCLTLICSNSSSLLHWKMMTWGRNICGSISCEKGETFHSN